MILKRSTLITISVVALFAALLLYSTLSAQKEECDVCVAYGDATNCATATAATEADAARSAQATACGTIARGMAESINCGETQPTKRSCRHAA